MWATATKNVRFGATISQSQWVGCTAHARPFPVARVVAVATQDAGGAAAWPVRPAHPQMAVAHRFHRYDTPLVVLPVWFPTVGRC